MTIYLDRKRVIINQLLWVMTMTTQKQSATNANTLPPAFIIPAPTLQPTNTPPPNAISLPLDGYSRASQLIPFLPIGLSTLWKWAKNGRFPAPVKLSNTVTAWRNQDVHQWFKDQYAPTDTPASNDDNNNGGVA